MTTAASGRRGDAVCFLLAVAFTALTLVDDRDRDLGTALVVTDAVLGGICCLGVWWRRRWPVAFALLAITCSVVSPAASTVAMIALFTLAVHRRLRVVGAVLAVAAVAALVSVTVQADGSSPGVADVVLGLACLAAVLASGMLVRARRQLRVSVATAQERAEADRLEQARLHERHRIAREMHDVLAHRISLVSLHAGALELRPDGSPDEVARAAGVIRDSAHRALEDLRTVIGVLRADGGVEAEAPERPQPTLADLTELIEESRRAGTRVRLRSRLSDPAAAPASIGRDAYRIVQEGLTNARKHAPDAEVSVTVDGARGTGLTVEVRNPTPPGPAGEPVVPGAGSGLVGLVERVDLAGGRLEHGRLSGGDYRLRAWLPWP